MVLRKKMRYCTNRLMSDTWPDQNFNDAVVCNVCPSYQDVNKIDWSKREIELNNIIEAPAIGT